MNSDPAATAPAPDTGGAKYLLQMHLLVVLFATTALLSKLISLSPAALVVWRTAFACLGGLLWAGVLEGQPLWPGRRRALALLGIGLIVGLHWICFFWSIALSNISICLAGMAATSLFTAFTEPLLEKRRVRPFEVLLGLLIVAGISLVAGFARSQLPGLGVALISAFLAAIFPVLNRRLVQTGGNPRMMIAWEMAGACAISLALLPAFGPWSSLLAWHGYDWLWLLVLAWVCTVFGHGFHIHLLRHLSAYTSNLAINFEPIYGTLGAALFFGEYRQVHPLVYVGILAIVLSNLLHPLILRWARK